jgi:FixJ family two-component response regulator
MIMYEDFGTGKRGKEGLDYVAEELGKAPKEIAFLLKVSVKTVEAHRAQLMERLASTCDWPGE